MQRAFLRAVEFHKRRIGVHETPHPVQRDVSHEHVRSIRDRARMCQGCTSDLGGLPSLDVVEETYLYLKDESGMRRPNPGYGGIALSRDP